MMKAIKELFTGFWSLLVGMKITLQQFFKPQVTVQYPHQSLKMPKRFRGHIMLVKDVITGKSVCIACKSCEKACPSDCIVVDGLKREGDKKKSVSDFMLDFTKCSLCGSCVEVCPVDALAFSRDYNLASTSKEQFYQIDLYKRVTEGQPQ
ncbi:MAG: NADH-quinone oxidoreductase subunit I [Verrucomicrobia bacterium]|jgi:NADH-quinone oxidoreductase subunit I|nr:NADH-quinone oxidoreductase subunit I [Verrucomicrobiota bacterium]